MVPTTRPIRQLMDLSGRVALVTGGAGHIGSALADCLAEFGARVAVMDVCQDKCNSVAAAIHEKYHLDAIPIVADLKDSTAIRQVPSTLQQQFGRLDILINCAAMVGTDNQGGWITAFEDQDDQVWREALEINLTAPFVLTQACSKLIAQSGHGSIINVASIYGMVGPDWRMYDDTKFGNPAAYGASKGGLLQFTRWLATTLAPNIRVNAISPGGVYRDTPEPFHARYKSRVPLGRMAREEDLCGAAIFLASDMSAYVTGQNLVVDGGWTAW